MITTVVRILNKDNFEDKSREFSFNRTILELKHVISIFLVHNPPTFNRTI